MAMSSKSRPTAFRLAASEASMFSQNRKIVVTVKPEHFHKEWRLVGKFHRRTNELLELLVMPPEVTCPADARQYYCLLMLNGSIRDTLRLRGLNNLDRPLTWTFDSGGQELGWC
ncbi:glr4048 [Gloeobacter violaceus PCC 7421]|uniref:Glr4048 protein n=2 Tax=Gloeobacter violaceus TaxID=33072 RepID=Q7NE32_GLOVI|nr:glr4048 [Gloeobacter violaceus PCC 7421]